MGRVGCSRRSAIGKRPDRDAIFPAWARMCGGVLSPLCCCVRRPDRDANAPLNERVQCTWRVCGAVLLHSGVAPVPLGLLIGAGISESMPSLIYGECV